MQSIYYYYHFYLNDSSLYSSSFNYTTKVKGDLKYWTSRPTRIANKKEDAVTPTSCACAGLSLSCTTFDPVSC